MNITEAVTAPEDKQKSSFTSGEEEKAEVAELELDKGDSDDIIDIAVSHAAPGTTGPSTAPEGKPASTALAPKRARSPVVRGTSP